MANEWQPIITAPRNGETILVWDGFGVMGAVYQPVMTFDEWRDTVGEYEASVEEFREWEEDAREDGEYDCFQFFALDAYEDIVEAGPTHWMPVPKGPK